MLCDQIDDGAAHDDAVAVAGDIGGLLGRAHAKADDHGQVGSAFRRATASSMLVNWACCLPVIPATET
jgi:hypothetical protein